MLNAPKVDISIYKELINLFFNSKSFFFFVISDMLKKKVGHESLINTDIVFLIQNLVNKLVEAEDAYSELEKLSKCQAFDSFINKFIEFISSLALNGSDEEKRKELIASVSQYFLEQLVIITRDVRAQQDLASYLDLRLNFLPQNNYKLNSKSKNLLPKRSKRENKKSSSDFERLRENFKNEVIKTLDSLNQVYENGPEINSKFLLSWQKHFEHLKFISMLNGFEDIEAISDRMLRIAEIYFKKNNAKLSELNDLYAFAIESIQMIAKDSNGQINIISVLRTLDHFLETGEFNGRIAEDRQVRNSEDDFNEILTKENNSSQYIDNVDDNNGNDIDFKLPGEDDPELLALLNEISGSNKQSTTEKVDQTDRIKEITEKGVNRKKQGALKEKPIRLKNESENTVDLNIKIFIEETALFFKLIKSALVTLNEDPEDESSLEDLELASHSLKTEAMKLGFEKLSKIPQLIEDIAKYAIAHKLHLPNHMLNTISKAIVLLQSVKKDEKDREKFRQIQKELHTYFLNLKKRFRTNQ